MSEDKEYEGWKNYATWNVSLWINNDYNLYCGARDFMNENPAIKDPYKKFITSCGLDTQQTPDRIKYRSLKLDYKALNDMMKELIEEAK
jgi:hypothetical protein